MVGQAATPLFAAPAASQLKLDTSIRPFYNITSVADLEKSPWLLLGDGKGTLSVWNVGPDMNLEKPEFVLEAHSGPVHQVIQLHSSRLQEVLEELQWPPEQIPGVPRKVVARGPPPLDDEGSASTAASDGDEEDPAKKDDLEPSGGPVGALSSDSSSRKRGVAGCLRRFCCCLCNRQRGKGGKGWRSKKFKRVPTQHWMAATAGEDGSIKVWRFRQSSRKRPRSEEEALDYEPVEADFITEWTSKSHIPVTGIMELYDGLIALALGGSPDVRILDPATSQIKSVLFGHTGQLLCMAICTDGRLVTGAADGSVRLWARRMWEDEEARTRALAGGEETTPVEVLTEDRSQLPQPQPEPGSDQDQDQEAVQVHGAESTRPRPRPALGWAAPDQEPASAGVSNTAFFAHMQQAEKGESVNLSLRVYIFSAESLPKDGQANPYVHCYVAEGADHLPAMLTSARTLSKEEPVWDHRCGLTLRRALVDGEWQLPECSWLDFELFLEPRSRRTGEVLLGHWSQPLEDVITEIERDPIQAELPQPRKLYAPTGEGPYGDLKASVLNIGFGLPAFDTLECIIGSAVGLPENMKGTLYVRAHIRQTLPGRSRRIPPRHHERTRVVPRSANPFFDDVLVLEVPVHLADRQLAYGPELHLQLEVYDQAAETSEDLLGTLSVPFATALQMDSQDPHPYNLVLPPQQQGPKAKQKKRRGELSGGDILEQSLAGLVPISRLHLGFQAIAPTPMQLRCTVEYGSGVPLAPPSGGAAGRTSTSSKASRATGTFIPHVRMSLMEGNPLPAFATAARTLVYRRELTPEDVTASPVWNEKCFLKLPDWIWEVSLAKAAPNAERASVREGWEHPHKQEPRGAVVCIDVYDCDSRGVDKYLGRAIVPLAHAYNAARSGTGKQPRAVSLSCLPDSFLWIGFEMGADDSQFAVLIAKADDLPLCEGSTEVAMSCVVRIAELGAFYTPTDKEDLQGIAAIETPPGLGHPRNPEWHHEEMFELPGGDMDSVLAARPNWYVLFEVLDSDPRAADAPPLAIAAAPLADVLSQCAEAQAPAQKSTVLQRRIANFRAPIMPPKHRVAAAPGTGARTSSVPILRELPLVTRRHSLEARDQPESPRGWRERFKQRTRSLSSPRLRLDSSPSSPRRPTVADDGLHDDDRMLVVRFEVLSRWKGSGGGAKCPATRPMHGPSPVRSLVALVSSVVAGHENGNIFIWDVTGCSAVPLHQFQAHKVAISCMVHLPTIDCLVTTALPTSRKDQVSESLLRVWGCSTLDLRQTMPLHGSGSKCLVPLSTEGKGGSEAILALGKQSRQSSLLQLLKLEKLDTLT